jgi:uncharacterized protein (DUF433 family)
MKALEEIETQDHPRQSDLIDWHGSKAVQFDPEKLAGRATVGATRMDAHGILIHCESGMTPEEISETFNTNLEAIREILAFPLSPFGGCAEHSLRG